MEIILTAIDKPLLSAWQEICGDLPGVSVHYGSILEVECDAVVSPANSFGFMDGGIDMLYTWRFGPIVQERVQKAIQTYHYGELPVGNALIVPTDAPDIPYLIAAPTMRVPMILRETVNPYLAARAVFLLVKHGVFLDGPQQGQPIADTVRRVALPGMGTGVGRVEPAICAQQVRRAFRDVVLEKATFPQSWEVAQVRHQWLYTDKVRDLQYEP